MNLDSLSFALSQISYAVAGLTKKNFKSNVQEISNLVGVHGAEADRHLYRCLFSFIDFSSDARGSGKDTYQIQYLIQECSNLIAKPNFVSIFCYSLDNPLHQQKTLRPTPQLFSQLSKVLKLTCVQEVALGLAALKSSNPDTRKYATQFIKQRLPQLINSYIDSDSGASGSESGGGLRDTPIEVLHLVLSYLVSPVYKDTTAVSVEQKNNFLKALSKEFSRDRVPVVLAPLLYQDQPDIALNKLFPDQQDIPVTMVETSLSEMLQEQGPALLKSVDQCKSAVNQFGLKNITTGSVARCLSMMAKNSDNAQGGWMDGGSDGSNGMWKADVFCQVIKELMPSLSWLEVVKELDHAGFVVTSKTSLSVLTQALTSVLGQSFPISHLYTLWNNKDGQMSWIIQAIKNPEVFCFADYPHRPVVTECLKTMPDEENRDVAIWKSLDLIDILLQLSCEGYHVPCCDLFKYPVAHCPDLLLLGIVQTPRWVSIKMELLTTLVPTFLGYHPNSTQALYFAWHCQHNVSEVRHIIMDAMSDWYMRGDPHDQTRLSRVLDLSQDIKALTMLLNASEFTFIIDLACLASRREYLKLDKWVNDKVQEYGEPFLRAYIKFLHQRVPQLSSLNGGGQETLQGINKSHHLPVETISHMVNCLKAFITSVSPELGELILKTCNSASILISGKQLGVVQQAPGAPSQQQPVAGPVTSGLPSSAAAAVAAAMRNPMPPPIPSIHGLAGLTGQVKPQQQQHQQQLHQLQQQAAMLSMPSPQKPPGHAQSQSLITSSAAAQQQYSSYLAAAQGNSQQFNSQSNQYINQAAFSSGHLVHSESQPSLSSLESKQQHQPPHSRSFVSQQTGLNANAKAYTSQTHLASAGSNPTQTHLSGAASYPNQLSHQSSFNPETYFNHAFASEPYLNQVSPTKAAAYAVQLAMMNTADYSNPYYMDYNGMDSLSALGPLPGSMIGGQTVSGMGGTSGLVSLTGAGAGAPGSPAKSYTPLGGQLGPLQPGQQPYSSMQAALNSQFQGLNLHSGGLGGGGGLGTGLGPGGLGTGLGPGSLGPGGLGPGLALGGGLMSGLGPGGGGLGQGIGTGLGTGFGTSMAGPGGVMGMGSRSGGSGAQSLGALSAQVALGQQPQQQPRMDGARRATQASELTNIFPTQSAGLSFSKDVEDEANSYFQRIYNTTTTPSTIIEQTLDMLKRFKDSAEERERDVFQCMLRNLFEEYRFFQQYPDKELQITAILFGGIIENGLVTYMALGVALRYVLEALKKPQNSKMYYFGLTALDRCKAKLKEYPQYCQFLASIPHFSDFPPVLKEYIEYGSRSMEAPSAARIVPPPVTGMPAVSVAATTSVSTVTTTTTTVATTTSSTATTTTAATHGAISRPANTGAPSRVRASIATATNIDTLLANKDGTDNITVPSETLQDRVFFIFNNLSQSNMEQKASELLECVGTDFQAWVAQYLVMKRASIEHNFHTLYANFIDNLKSLALIKMVVKETYRNIKVLLRSDKGVANFSDRTLLKNLGHWLGMLTLAKNKPILYVDIDLKSLIFEAYHKGAQELLYVVPFVAKVIESAVKSKIFRPPNPWTMGIMYVLGELHREPDIRLNLKFEIEVLCKHLTIDVNELPVTHYLKDMSRGDTMVHQLSPPSAGAGAGATAGGAGAAKPKDAMTPQPEEPLQINMPTPTSAILAAGAAPAGLHPPGSTVMPITTMAVGMVTSPMTSAGVPGAVTQPNQPQFSYNDINIMSPNGLAQLISVNEAIPLLQAHPQLKQYIKPAIERAVQELLAPTIDRAMKIAINTSEQIVKKDFALDPDEGRMMSAAHHLVRFMTAGMALITAHEPIHVSISNQLKTIFMANVRASTQQQKDMIEQAANMIAADNTDLATNFIQKTAVEKALPEIDKRLASDYELRKHARAEGRRYCDPLVLTYQAERMPEQIRLKVGGITPQQSAIYDEFSRNIPGFLPSDSSSVGGMGVAMGPGGGGMSVASIPGAVNVNMNTSAMMKHPYLNPQQQLQPFSIEDIHGLYDKIQHDIDQHLRAFSPNSPLVPSLRTLLEYVLLARNAVRDQNPALALLHRAVEGLLEGLNLSSSVDVELMYRYRDSHLLVLQSLVDPRMYGPQWAIQKISRCVMECREEFRYNIDAVECLIKNQLVYTPQYDLFIAQQLESAASTAVATQAAGGVPPNSYVMLLGFVMQLVQRFCTDTSEKFAQQRLPEGEFCHTIEVLARVAAVSRQPPDGLATLLDAVRSHNGGDVSLLDRSSVTLPSMMHSGINQAKETDDPPGLHEKTEYLLREWVTLYHSPAAGRDSKTSFSTFVGQMHYHGILKTDDLITRFFRLCTEMCVDLCYRALSDPSQGVMHTRVQCFHTLDAFVRLIALLLKHSGDTHNTITKTNLLNKVLGIVVGVMQQDHASRRTEFQMLPYHRIFIMLFLELTAPEPIFEMISFDVLQAYCNTYHILRPGKAPGFAYAWLELVSHRSFMGRMLALNQPNLQQKVWGMYAQLLMDQFKFLAPYLRNADLNKPTQLLYKGTMRVLLVLLHDFPEFLCDYHYAFCDVIPSNCIQLRNLVLSAFPRTMRLPDPFTPNLKVDILPEISTSPHILTNFTALIQPERFKKDMDSYLKTRSPVTFLSELRGKLQVSSMPGMKYNVTLMNALVLHVGTQAIAYIASKGQTPSMSTIAHSSHMDIFQNLAVDLDTEGRYLFLNAIANQLRYPNSHTHYFSCTILYLFAEANTEAIQEQITRVLLERLIVNRPHPWGLLITFIELIKNPVFKFWNHDFVHCAPEIEKLLDSVARSCMPIKPGLRGDLVE